MTFELSPEVTSLQTNARDLAETILRPAASAIDEKGAVPASVSDAVAALGLTGAPLLARVVAIEELAVASAASAAAAALSTDGLGTCAGLRGVSRVPDAGPDQQLAMAAVCLGIGRAAVETALGAAKARGDRPGGDASAPPHWALADAATEMDAARLLVRASAAGQGLSSAAVLVFASGAAVRAVDAALRIVGPEGYGPGTILERLARDARAATLIVGTEDSTRRAAADALLG